MEVQLTEVASSWLLELGIKEGLMKMTLPNLMIGIWNWGIGILHWRIGILNWRIWILNWRIGILNH